MKKDTFCNASAPKALDAYTRCSLSSLCCNNTASASESLINGLRGIDFEVILIGGSTTGKPYGWLPEENCGTTYSTIQFKGVNAKGFGNYSDGFIPSTQDNGGDQVKGCIVYEDIKHLLGDKNEKMLATAIYHIDRPAFVPVDLDPIAVCTAGLIRLLVVL